MSEKRIIQQMKGLILLLLVGWMGFNATDLNAKDQVVCRIRIVEASRGGDGMDKVLQPYAELFERTPFLAFDTFRVLGEKQLSLRIGETREWKFEGALSGSLTFSGMDDGAMKFMLKLNRSEGKPVLIEGKASSGTPFIAAGLKSETGRWVIAVECRE